MRNEKVVRGFVLVAIALFFGLQAMTYQVGTLARAGAGLFPLMVSGALALIGLVMIVEARFEDPVPLRFNFRNIALILLALVGFVLIAEHLKMLLAIVYLVFVASLAGDDYSIRRNLQISAVLIAIAFAFHHFLGLQLPLL